MKAKKQILGLLLSAFIFMAMHDFIIGYIDPDTQTELYMHQVKNQLLCEASVLHELIHQVLMTIEQISSPDIYFTYNKTWSYSDIDNTFSSLLKHRLYRPPII